MLVSGGVIGLPIGGLTSRDKPVTDQLRSLQSLVYFDQAAFRLFLR